MPTVCAVYGCTNKTTNKSVSFFRFPKKKKSAATDLQKLQEDQRNMWLKSLHRVDLKNKQVDAMRICSSHFKSGKPACYTNNKHPDWCPSINMGYKTNKGAATTPDIKRYHRATKQMALTPTILFPNDLENDTVVQSSAVVAVPNSNDGENMDVSKETGTSTSTTITMADIQTLEQEMEQSSTQIHQLQTFLYHFFLRKHIANKKAQRQYASNIPQAQLYMYNVLLRLLQKTLKQSMILVYIIQVTLFFITPTRDGRAVKRNLPILLNFLI
eukprot:XP_016656146.1 PREDICTED: uncharacterized protein LOC100160969 isoform X1 [Acyrthosiphon pisum]